MLLWENINSGSRGTSSHRPTLDYFPTTAHPVVFYFLCTHSESPKTFSDVDFDYNMLLKELILQNTLWVYIIFVSYMLECIRIPYLHSPVPVAFSLSVIIFSKSSLKI